MTGPVDDLTEDAMPTDALRIAHRVWTEPVETKNRSRSKKKERRTGNRKLIREKGKPLEPEYLLVFDCETTNDHLQSLTFGSWRYYRVDDEGMHCVQEGLFHDDDLETADPAGLFVLRTYVASQMAGTERPRPIQLYTLSEFVERVLFRVIEMDGRIIGFNLAFDLSRLAIEVTDARGFNLGGHSFVLAKPKDGSVYKERRHRPRIVIKHRDAKGSFISTSWFIGAEEWLGAGGRFLDLRTLAFALTGKGYTLAGACEAFDVPGKIDPGGYGKITPQHIDYCRQDVAATASLYGALIAEYRLHPIDLEPERAYSPASIAKAYLAAMGIAPLLERHRDFPQWVLGIAMASFFGGRAECRIRRVSVPVRLYDFTSMYPSVDALYDLHRLQLAERIEVHEHQLEVGHLLFDDLTLEECFDPSFWPTLCGFALVDPNEDILPVRASYNTKTWGIGVNPVTSDELLWYSLADCAACALLTGRGIPVRRLVMLAPAGGSIPTMPVLFRGSVTLDPTTRDPMVTIVEERQRIKRDTKIAEVERERSATGLKVVGNGGSYGIYSEFNARTARRGETTKVEVFGRKDSFFDRVGSPEDPGRYCFPPFASWITGGARLMLAMLERCVTDLGGTYAFCDTDSMAPVATPDGGFVPCPGGPESLPDGTEVIRALSYAECDAIQARFDALNPYDRSVVPDLLKLETESLCYAVSAKRYCLYALDDKSEPVFDKDHPPSEHGLGHFLNPTDPESSDRQWIADLWRVILSRVHGSESPSPDWLKRPTMVRTTVTSTTVRRAFCRLNDEKAYTTQVKPFNFLLTAAGARPPASVPVGESFRLVAPYETDPTKWEEAEWIDAHHPERGTYRITTRDGRPGMARVDTFASVLAKYETHAESKSLGPDGKPCGRATVGLLRRRPVTVGRIVLIGKESNRLEERSRGELTVDELDQRITAYEDHDEWYRVVLPKLREMGAKAVAEAMGMSERRVRDVLSGRALPHASHRTRLHEMMR